MLKLNYFLADIFILSAEKQPIKLSWRKIEWLQEVCFVNSPPTSLYILDWELVTPFVFLFLSICMAISAGTLFDGFGYLC